MKIIECIPNFSDARRPEVVEAIVNAVAQIPNVHILDQHSDLDHNRTVLTFIGDPAGVEEAAYQGIAKAVELIDLNQHQGEHPRLGAADVVPGALAPVPRRPGVPGQPGRLRGRPGSAGSGTVVHLSKMRRRAGTSNFSRTPTAISRPNASR